MVLTFKIRDLQIITQVKQELNLLSMLDVNEIITVEEVILSVNVGSLSVTEFHEPAYDFIPESKLEFKFLPLEKTITLTEKELELSEVLMGVVDDLVFDELGRLEAQAKGFTKRTYDIDWGKFEETINAAPSLDSLYHKIKHDEEWNDNRKVALYKVLLHSDRILDLENVYDFIDNFFEIRFADLILKYPLKKELLAKILNNPNINPVVLSEYEERHSGLEPIEQVLASKDQGTIESYYFKLIKRKSEQNINKELNSIIKSSFLSTEIINSLLVNYDISFIYDDILAHPNCPIKTLEKYAVISAYGISILKNPHTPSNIIDRMVDHFLGYDNQEKFIEAVLAHQNTLQETKDKINTKKELTKNFLQDLNPKNLDFMINNREVKFNLDEIYNYASSLKKEGRITEETFTIILESFSDARKKVNKIISEPAIMREYSDWDPERTIKFIQSSQADETICESIYKKELINKEFNLLDETPIMNEISAKYDNLLKFSIREDIVNKLKAQASDPSFAPELAEQILNNVHFLNNKFSLSDKEKQEIISSLIQNQELTPHLRDKLIQAS